MNRFPSALYLYINIVGIIQFYHCTTILIIPLGKGAATLNLITTLYITYTEIKFRSLSLRQS